VFAMILLLAEAAASRPNFVYILTDDTDLLLGSPSVLRQTRELLGSQGAELSHFMTLSPKCTPSRTGQLVGRHYHNVRPADVMQHGGRGLNETTMFEPTGLFPMLHMAGYWTSIVGKVHNNQKRWLCSEKNTTTPFTHVSTLCSPCGNYWGNQYVVKQPGESTTRMEQPLPMEWSTYSHAQFGNRSTAFMREAVKAGKPFFAHIGTTGPHLPSQPAPWHATEIAAWTANVTAPHTPDFDFHAKGSHPSLAGLPSLKPHYKFVDQHHRDRLGTLLSIDDLVAGVVKTLDELGVLENTYILFSADHGYHLGNWRLPQEKMWPFETDVRIPFYIRGPGIKPGTVVDSMGLNLDIAPTLLSAAGLEVPSSYDGRSLLPLLTGTSSEQKAARNSWRTRTVISFAEGAWQYWYGVSAIGAGGMSDPTVKQAQQISQAPAKAPDGTKYHFDDPSNQWRMLRVSNKTHDISFIEWDPLFMFKNVTFSALFDISADPHQLQNIWPGLSRPVQTAWHHELDREFRCSGQLGDYACS